MEESMYIMSKQKMLEIQLMEVIRQEHTAFIMRMQILHDRSYAWAQSQNRGPSTGLLNALVNFVEKVFTKGDVGTTNNEKESLYGSYINTGYGLSFEDPPHVIEMYSSTGGDMNGGGVLANEPDIDLEELAILEKYAWLCTPIYGTSMDITLTPTSGGSIEIMRINDKRAANWIYFSYGTTHGLEASSGFNFVKITPFPGFKIKDLLGESSGFTISTPFWIGYGHSGNTTGTYGYNEKRNVTYKIERIGVGLGLGYSFYPNNNTIRFPFYYYRFLPYPFY